MTKQTWKAAIAAVFAAVVATGTLGMTGSDAKVAGAATNIYVSPRGDDSADGSLERPFATVGRARDAVRDGLVFVLPAWVERAAVENGEIVIYTKPEPFSLMIR